MENEKEDKKQEMFKKVKQRKQEGRTVRKIVGFTSLAIILIIGIVAFAGYTYIQSALEPVDPEATTGIEVEIPIGSSLTTIAKILQENGIIKDAQIFKYYTKFKNESDFQAGNYTMTQSMTLDEIIESLKTGRVYREPVFTVTVPEGLTLEQIANVIEKNTEFTADEFMKKVTNLDFVESMIGTYPELITEDILNENIRFALEGYLYPATYSFYEENPSLEEIIKTMISQTEEVLKGYSALLEEKQMTVHELLTFASLLEEEATAQTDRETIASVFYNRLEIGMPLQTDPTVLYALGSHKDQVLYEDLKVENPYNTYVINGLPPGPIANAGKTSLEAVLNPTKTEYLYFLADKEGTNHFAKTYDEHLKNIDTYLR